MTGITAHVEGHYEATKTPWATDYVWVPGEEAVEGASSMGSSVPGRPLTPSRSKNSWPIPKNNTGGRWKPFEVGGAHASSLATPPAALPPCG